MPNIEERLNLVELTLKRHAGTTQGVSTNQLPHPNMSANVVYSITNGTLDRSYDANATTTDELADILYTLIQDLKLLGIVG